MTIIKDDLKNIQRIIDTILADPNIFDNGETKGLLNSVQFGNPPNMEYDSRHMPYAYVTTADSLQKTSYPFGISTSSSVSQITAEYKIIIVTDMDGEQVGGEKKLYNLLKLMRITLTADPTFKDPDSNDDPIFTRSIINESKWNIKTKGKTVQVIEFTLIATIGSAFIVNFPGIGDVILLSKPNAPEGIVFSDDREQKPTPNRVLTENGNFGSLDVEYEATVSLDDLFRAKFGVEEDITIITASGAKVYHVMYVSINPTAQFDSIERSILHMEIIPN